MVEGGVIGNCFNVFGSESPVTSIIDCSSVFFIMVPIFVRRSGSGVLYGIGISKGHSRSLQLPPTTGRIRSHAQPCVESGARNVGTAAASGGSGLRG